MTEDEVKSDDSNTIKIKPEEFEPYFSEKTSVEDYIIGKQIG